VSPSLDSPGATHLAIHADVNFVVACRCAQDPAVLGQISLRKCGHDAARKVVGDREHDVVADPKFSPHPAALHEPGVVVLGTHDDVGPEAPDLELALHPHRRSARRRPLCGRRRAKMFISNGRNRDLLVVATTTSPDEHKGLTLLVIDGYSCLIARMQRVAPASGSRAGAGSNRDRADSGPRAP
jgi:hypothetical protein